MATPHDKLAPMNETSPSSEDNNYIEEDYEEYSPTRSPGYGCCFNHLCLRTWQKRENNSYRHLTQQAEKSSQTRETWFSKNLKAAKEFSEVLAGPKWKNFIRKFSENGIFINTCSSSSSSKKRRMQFQYDPQSYALNFDDGVDKEGDGTSGGGVHIDFAARYSCRSSIDFDQEK